MKVIYTRPLTIKTSELTLMNQLNDSDHYIMGGSPYYGTPSTVRLSTVRFEQHFYIKELLKVTPTCQYVVYDSLFLSFDYHMYNEEG